jgi:hypothetical protein
MKPRPCPECGKPPQIMERVHDPKHDVHMGAVTCPHCLITALGDTTQMAIDAWELTCDELEEGK